MKIKVIGQALDEIKEEDQKALRMLEDEILRIETTYSSQKEEVNRLKGEHQRYEELDGLANNGFKRFRMILPVIEIPLGIIIATSAIIITIPNLAMLLAIGIAMALGLDAVNTLVEKYPDIKDSEIKGFKAYVDVFNKLLLDKKAIRHLMINAYTKLLGAKDKANASEIELNRAKGEFDQLQRELLHLEGYISSIEYIVEKQYFEELSDTTDIVQFINAKKELKRVTNQ